MLEKSYGLTFFLKSPKNKKDIQRYVHVRVTVDGVPKETSTKRKWDANRWDQKTERATGNREDARSFNFFLDSLVTAINQFKVDQRNQGKSITARCIVDFIKGEHQSRAKVLEEFQKHNERLDALVKKDERKRKEKELGIDTHDDEEIEYAPGTYQRYEITRRHVQNFILYKYKVEDLEFRELNYEFIKDFEFYLKTVKNQANNTALKYISNFRKIVNEAIDQEIISADPFARFKGKRTRGKKRALTQSELQLLERKAFTSNRLTMIRDIFIFQCYTGLAYIDIFLLKRTDIKEGIDGNLWIMNRRQKTDSITDIPLLPKALELIKKYKDHPDCISKGTVFPVKSNQKMNDYLKEIAAICGVSANLTVHKARHTFATTVTLANDVPIHVVKHMLGHSSVKQTEDYARTEQKAISREMIKLAQKLKAENGQQEESNLI